MTSFGKNVVPWAQDMVKFSGEVCPLHWWLSPGVQLRALEDVPVFAMQYCKRTRKANCF